MSKKPFYFFWRPLNFEATRNDLRTIPDALVKLYFEVLEAYWLAGCDLDYTELRDGLGTRGRELDRLFHRVKSLNLVDGKVIHEHTRHEFERALRKSGRAVTAAALRWSDANAYANGDANAYANGDANA